MQEPDYHAICESIAGIIAHGDKPLTQMQKMSLVGSVSIWLSQRDARIAEMEKAIKELHQVCDSGESDIRAIGPIIDRFPELR